MFWSQVRNRIVSRSSSTSYRLVTADASAQSDLLHQFQSSGQSTQHLVDLFGVDDERWGQNDGFCRDQPTHLKVEALLREDVQHLAVLELFFRQERFGRLVAYQLDRAEEAKAADVPDDLEALEFVQTGLEPFAHHPRVLHQAVALDDL